MTGSVAHVVGETLAAAGVDVVFGLMGSGNLVATNAVGGRFVAARHEGGAVGMADGWARTTGRVGVASVHQGPGLTNTLTALAEAAKSRTPLLVLSGETPAADLTSNFRIDQHGLVESVGAIAMRVHSPQTAAGDVLAALRRASVARRPVVLMLPIDVQGLDAVDVTPVLSPPPCLDTSRPGEGALVAVAALIDAAQRPLIVGGRGAVLSGARDALETLGARIGALLATSAVANGLFDGLSYDVGIAGGFSTPSAVELIGQADLVLAFGATLNQWTTRHGRLLAPGARVVRVDVEMDALGRLPADFALVGDAAATARALTEFAPPGAGFRGAPIEARRWNEEPFEPARDADTIDPRTLSVALDELLPADRAVAIDSGHMTGWPAMYLRVRDPRRWLFVNAFQAVGLALGPAIGAAVADPGRITVAALGDGGAFLSLAELETAARLELPLLVLIYDDHAYGAEVHHFGPLGERVDGAQFPPADLAAVARSFGAGAVTVRRVEHLEPVREWAANPAGPLVVDAKVDPGVRAEWLADAFRKG